MFCPNCGIEIKNPETFCPNCGTRLGKGEWEVPVNVQNELPQTVPAKHKKSAFPKIALAVVPIAAVAAVAGFFVYKQSKVIDLNDYYTLKVTGYNGNGTVELVFDSEKFEDKYKDKLSMNEKKARKWVEKYGDDDYVEESIDSLKSYEPVESMCDTLEQDFYEISPETGLSNGDTVTFKANEDAQEGLEMVYDCKIKNISDYEVEGLKDVEEYDPFADFSVTFKGTNGSGTAEITNPKDELGQELEYSVENNGSLSNGDTVEIDVQNAEDDFVEKYSKVLTGREHSVEVSGLAEPTPTPVPTEAPLEGPALRSDFYKDGQITGTDPNYIIPDSLDRVLSYEDISHLNAKGLSFARNEMMARMGRGFKNQDLANYFNSMPWYQVTVSPDAFDSQALPSIVEANAALMKSEELRLNGGQLYIK